MESITPERLQSMITSRTPAVRQRGLQLLAESLRSANRDPQIAQMARVLAGGTLRKNEQTGKPEPIKYSSEAKALRIGAEQALSAMADAGKIRAALGAVLLQDDAAKRKAANLEG